uniref:inositol-polyphosphate 5-phosphatase n=1 Tax=Amphilophus citrinellus TaxID=61819 RepID=A0A3Q0SID4_AMPCI
LFSPSPQQLSLSGGIQSHKPHFVALHCQEVGGKNYEASMSHVDNFVKELLSSDVMNEYSRARVYLDENYKSQEHFTALGSFYFIHDSLNIIQQFDFKAKTFINVSGKEIYSETLESTPTLEKEKFPQDYFPECKWSRKGFIRTRWVVADYAFDLVNIHLFHDASNIVAWEKSPSVYSGTRQKALRYVLGRITDRRYDKLPFFVFGDFNFRLDSRKVVNVRICLCEQLSDSYCRPCHCESAHAQLMFHGCLSSFFFFNVFSFFPQFLEFDRELLAFKDRLHELQITFPPSYPYSEDSNQGKQYMNTRCPAWCDRILMSPSARDLFFKPENEDSCVVYDNIGASVCMGDHKPVFLSFRITAGAGKRNANKRKCCVVQ